MSERAGSTANGPGYTVTFQASMPAIAQALGNLLQQASPTLGRQAAGEQVEPTPQGHAEVAFDGLFSGWAAERKPAPKTIYEWRRVLDQFAEHLGHSDAGKVKAEGVIAWKDALVAAGRHSKKTRCKACSSAKYISVGSAPEVAAFESASESMVASGNVTTADTLHCGDARACSLVWKKVVT